MSQDVTPSEKNILEDFHNVDFEAVFTDSQLTINEAEYNETWGVKRRLMGIVMARSRSELMENATAETCLDLYDQISSYCDHLKAGLEIAEAACARLLVVGSALNEQTLKN